MSVECPRTATPGINLSPVRGIVAPLRDIFLSYEHTDHSKARKLAESLEHEGWTVWWDPRIPPGQTWATVIESCLKSSRCVVVLWSETSIKSKWVNKEARFADKFDLLVPALIHDVKPPFEFEHIQAANLIDWDGTGTEGFSHLTAELRSRLQSPDGQTAPAIENAQPQPKPATNIQRGQQSEGSR